MKTIDNKTNGNEPKLLRVFGKGDKDPDYEEIKNYKYKGNTLFEENYFSYSHFKTRFFRDDDGKLISQLILQKSGEGFVPFERDNFFYDKNGKVIKEEHYEVSNANSDPSSNSELSPFSSTIFSRDNNGKLIESKSFDDEGDLSILHSYEYREDGTLKSSKQVWFENECEYFSYNGLKSFVTSGSRIAHTTDYFYDEKGRRILGVHKEGINEGDFLNKVKSEDDLQIKSIDESSYFEDINRIVHSYRSSGNGGYLGVYVDDGVIDENKLTKRKRSISILGNWRGINPECEVVEEYDTNLPKDFYVSSFNRTNPGLDE